jgi:hypothetical protein
MFASSVTLAPALRPVRATHGASPALSGFAMGTMIQTICGPMPVERLMAGDLLVDADGQIVELRGLQRRDVSARDLVQIDPSAIGLGMAPGDLMRPLVVAFGQSVAIQDWRTNVLFGKPALTAAQNLIDGVHVHTRKGRGGKIVTLFFDRPTLVIANGLRALVNPSDV